MSSGQKQFRVQGLRRELAIVTVLRGCEKRRDLAALSELAVLNLTFMLQAVEDSRLKNLNI
jgi:hypothetical protein